MIERTRFVCTSPVIRYVHRPSSLTISPSSSKFQKRLLRPSPWDAALSSQRLQIRTLPFSIPHIALGSPQPQRSRLNDSSCLKAMNRHFALVAFAGTWLLSHFCPTGSFSFSTPQFPLQAADEDAIRRQLGYLPSNFVGVSARKLKSNVPVAIKAYPLHGGAKRRQARATAGASSVSETYIGTPFPTLYWLTSQSISRAISELERTGYLRTVQECINSESDRASRLLACHAEYAMARWDSLSDADQSLLDAEDAHPSILRMRNILKNSGISGTNLTCSELVDDEPWVPPIKCLHAHYAQYRSTMDSPNCTQNPVGELVHEQLLVQFPDLDL